VTGRVVSLQVARPGPLEWRGVELRSAIAKVSVDEPLLLDVDGFAGDEQADTENHGGPDMAACLYASENLQSYAARLHIPLPPGAFGENLTTEGLLETDVNIGDTFALGAAVVQVSQPRGPCYKLAARHHRRELPALLARERRAGYLVRVIEPGSVQRGDRIELLERRSAISVAEVLRVEYVDRHDADAIAAVLAVPELAEQTAATLRALQHRHAGGALDFGGGVRVS
jgi:MOSC domain-containing protein YiiM